jgi:hypothetical protein
MGEVPPLPGGAAPAAGPPTSYGSPAAGDFESGFGGVHSGTEQWPRHDYYFYNRPAQSPRQSPLNTYAILSVVFGVLIPPAGVAFGYLALPQIKRTGQRGWLAAVCGLVIGYLLSAALVALSIWLLATGGGGSHAGGGPAPSAPGAAPPPSVVTSLAPAPMRPHTKLDLHRAAVGKCVEIQKRDEIGWEDSDEALDLYEVPCQHRVGVYTIVARVSTGAECNSTYVASPPDRSLAVCLNRY